ncbi:hypothetical protein C8J57DRAFT_1612073 [Mycena rebaudengoi]|nr:hypothetical protein C8J57DRAFT_1612073 [Mycena rebaudengoi]
MSQYTPGYYSIPIDPIVLPNPLLHPPHPPPPSQVETSPNVIQVTGVSPPNNSGWSREVYQTHLEAYMRKELLQSECDRLSLTWGKKDGPERLRGFLIDHWYPSADPSRNLTSSAPQTLVADTEISEAQLLAEFGVAGEAPDLELLGYDDDDEADEGEELDLDDDDVFEKLQTKTRVDAALRFEGNRRAGGQKTQKSMMKSWNMWLVEALASGEVKDDIVDEHSMLLFMKWSSERPQFSRNWNPKPGTRIGAIKKMFFGALRIRKTQEATNPKLKLTRPCVTVLVYDETKTRMDEALERLRNGLRLAPEEDAPDIIANTCLAQVTDDQLKSIGYGFLQYRELHQVVNGHLSWTCQNASGNRGDDFRALKLCEMQPYMFLHPNKETSVYCVLGLQGEKKAGKRGMKTIVNPSYTIFIAHRNPEICPLGAMAIYFHWLHDVYELPKKCLSIGRVTRAGEMVDSSDTAKLGWSRGTYMDTYAPALPKTAILGTHGYKVHENYDPIWRHVRVPEPFLSLMCPDSERILEKIEGLSPLRPSLSWERLNRKKLSWNIS